MRHAPALLALCLALLPLLPACNSDSSAARTVPDCEYARTLDRVTRGFTTALSRIYARDLELTPQETGRLFDALDADLGRLTAELQGLPLDRELERVNRLYVALIQDFRRGIPAMRDAATRGENDELARLLFDAGDDLASTAETLARDLPDATRRLARCRR